ncbi:unnamed protein product [Orchesella dallaii]|uniref:Uncharacterized protein n=1 Tax=Orchesella dallaii TaxID=48710 RepID=A0ABP1QD00_9HEXA
MNKIKILFYLLFLFHTAIQIVETTKPSSNFMEPIIPESIPILSECTMFPLKKALHDEENNYPSNFISKLLTRCIHGYDTCVFFHTFQFRNAYPVFDLDFFKFTHIHQILKFRLSTPCVTILLKTLKIENYSQMVRVSDVLGFGRLDTQPLSTKPPISLFILIPFYDHPINMRGSFVAKVFLLANIYWVFFDFESNEMYLPATLKGKVKTHGSNKIQSIKSPLSHASIAPIFKFSVQLEPHQVIKKWRTFNQFWYPEIPDDGTKYGALSKQQLQCDIVRSINPRQQLGESSVDMCIRRIIFNRHNCSEVKCQRFFSYLMNSQPLSNLIEKFYLPYFAQKFGFRYAGYRYVYFYRFERGTSIDMISLLKPVPFLGWLTLVGIILAMTTLLQHLKTCKGAVSALLRMALEQDATIENASLIGSSLVVLWLFACILVRNVYTSTIFTYITAQPLPKIPGSLAEAIENYTNLDILYDGFADLQYISIKKPPYQIDPVEDELNVLWRRNRMLYRCNLNDESATFYARFLTELTESSKIRCRVVAAMYGKTAIGYHQFTLGKNWGDFVLIYNPVNSYDMLISVLGNRWRFEPSRGELNMTMWGYLGNFDSIISSFIDDALGRFEQSGILQRLRDEIQRINTVLLLKKENEDMRLDLKRWINFYTAVSQLKSLVAQFGNRNDDEVKASTIETFLVSWVLYFGMVLASLASILVEILVDKFQRRLNAIC